MSGAAQSERSKSTNLSTPSSEAEGVFVLGSIVSAIKVTQANCSVVSAEGTQSSFSLPSDGAFSLLGLQDETKPAKDPVAAVNPITIPVYFKSSRRCIVAIIKVYRLLFFNCLTA